MLPLRPRLLLLIQTGAQTLERCPELSLSVSSEERSQEDEVSVFVKDFPFPITKGCYIAIEREYSSLLPEAQRRALRETITIVDVRIRPDFDIDASDLCAVEGVEGGVRPADSLH